MSSGTAAEPQDTAPGRSTAEDAARDRPGVPRQVSGAGWGDRPPVERRGRPNRTWAALTVAASLAFCVALVFGVTRLLVDVTDVSDTPERTVDAFLEALLDDRDAEAASAWLCADKSDRDLGGAIAGLSEDPNGFEWGEVTETERSVGAATVTAEIRVGSDGDEARSAPTTWVFSLVAEGGDPQWLICGVAAQ